MLFTLICVNISAMKTYDVIILGAGAAGLMAAAQLSSRKKSVLIIDMGETPARKVAVSGGGNCNFTNIAADFSHYFGKNPRFVMSGLAQFSPKDTLDWVRKHNIKYIEKEPGRYFCKNGAMDILNALLADIGDTDIKYNTNIIGAMKQDKVFTVKTNRGDFCAKSLVVATGGVSYPHLGTSNIGHVIAKSFGHKIEPIRPALCAMKTSTLDSGLAGISLPVEIKAGQRVINDSLLFTHFGIGGPAAYHLSLSQESKLTINFAPNLDVFATLKSAKQTNGKRGLVGIVATFLPHKLAAFLCGTDTRNIADFRDSELKTLVNKITAFEIQDARAVGFESAEVTFGGVSTDKISSKTMESKFCDGLYFAGEVIDIAGDLGGFNLQWAFSSGTVAGKNA